MATLPTPSIQFPTVINNMIYSPGAPSTNSQFPASANMGFRYCQTDAQGQPALFTSVSPDGANWMWIAG